MLLCVCVRVCVRVSCAHAECDDLLTQFATRQKGIHLLVVFYPDAHVYVDPWLHAAKCQPPHGAPQ